MEFSTGTAPLVLVVIFSGLAGTLLSGAALAHGDDVCLVEYKEGKFQNFRKLQRIDHREDSVMVHYIFPNTVLNIRYESAARARYWMGQVRKQLRNC